MVIARPFPVEPGVMIAVSRRSYEPLVRDSFGTQLTLTRLAVLVLATECERAHTVTHCHTQSCAGYVYGISKCFLTALRADLSVLLTIAPRVTVATS